MTETSNIAIVIVLYHPSADDTAFVTRIGELYHTVVVDNSVQNKGIAEAQNQGVRTALCYDGITHVVFLDQDSRVDDDYPLAIAREFDRIAQSRRLAMLGPSVENAETGQAYRSVIHTDHVTDMGFIPRREIISSGSCTTTRCLKDIGLNDGRLFIDYVDFEWCWRANSKGYVCGVTPNLCISHHVGQKTLSLFGYLIIISAPRRYFYQYRNYLWLARRNYVPLQWKIAMGIKCLARLVYFPLCIPSGTACWKYMLQGIREGLKK
jgi:rhamnosyltransferase